MQVLHVGHIHISTKGCKSGTAMVHDSLRTDDLPLSAKEVITVLVQHDRKKIFPDVQQQLNSSSCGLFALPC